MVLGVSKRRTYRGRIRCRRGAVFDLDALPQEMAFPTDLLVCEKLTRCLASGDLPEWLESCLASD
jgi:hypothetical protein